MSIGNLKDYGNKGNNFPWQYKMLQGLQSLLSIFSTPSGTPYLAPQQRYTDIVRVNSSGSYQGMCSISIANVGAADGTVKGVILKPNETVSFDAGALNNVLDTIDFVATGTEFLIIAVYP